MSIFNIQQIKPLKLPSLSLTDKRSLPSIRCVYFVLEGDEVVYLGRSTDLRFRWRQHHRYNDLKQLSDVRIAWLEVSDTWILQEIEMALIAWFEPKLNQTSSNSVWIERLEYLLANPKSDFSNLPTQKMFCRLAVLMAEKDPQLSQRQLAKETGLDITTINRLFTNNFSRVDVGTVEVLCNYFTREVGDLFEMRNPEDIPQRKSRKRSNSEVEAA
ncbi:helix-turn-helix domain-containing protein [Nostoc sp. CHAB 5834]|nr:helix-turn-helix domain-containing protein [Nostoc sp. CHAB 5834]